MSRVFLGILALTLLSGTAAAQQGQTPQASAPNKTAAATAPPNEIVTSRAPDPLGQPVNIKIDLTITDQMGPGSPSSRVVTLLVADRASGSIRSGGHVDRQGPVKINVDARPQILSNGNIRATLTLEYAPRTTAAEQTVVSASSLNEQMTVVLEPGKPLVISQAADAAADRKITVEVRATILK
jgi:hypothetical protein